MASNAHIRAVHSEPSPTSKYGNIDIFIIVIFAFFYLAMQCKLTDVPPKQEAQEKHQWCIGCGGLQTGEIAGRSIVRYQQTLIGN